MKKIKKMKVCICQYLSFTHQSPQPHMVLSFLIHRRLRRQEPAERGHFPFRDTWRQC